MADNANPVSFETAKQQAASVIAKMITGTPLNYDGEGNQFIDKPEVKITTQLGFKTLAGPSSDIPDMEVLNIEFANLGEHIIGARDVITQILEKLPVLPSHIKFGDAEKEADTTHSLIAELIDKGAELPKDILNWAQFSHANNENKSKWESAKHTTFTQVDGDGVTIHINLPKHLNAGMTMNDIKDNFESRKEQILNTFAGRIAKYKGVRGNQEEESRIREALNRLDFEVHSTGEKLTGEDTRSGEMFITLRSPEQKAAKELHDKEHPNDPIEANPQLESTNILQTIKPLELSKAAARAILSEDEKNTAVTWAIIGGKDVYRMLEKQLTKFKTAKPEYIEKVEAILASTLFTEDGYDTPDKKQHEVKQSLYFDLKDTENKIKIKLALPKDHAGKFIREVAKMAGPEVTSSPAPTQEAQKFSSVDKMQLVGIHSQNPAVHQELQKLAAPLAGQEVPAEKAEGFAENIIKLIEQAYQQVQDGKKALAQQADQKFEQQLAQSTGSESHGKPEAVLTPSSIASNRHPELDIHNLNWAQKLAAIAGQDSGYHLGA